jgi:cytidylate kinase
LIQQPKTIAIDGPAASGKTTLGRLLADELNYLFLDTGCMYRAVTLAVLDAAIDPNDEAAVVAIARAIELDVLPPAGEGDGRLYTVIVDGADATWRIRSEAVDRNVSQVSAYAGVRTEMVARQRAIGQQGGVVMVGRDIGTVVLPDAPLKLYVEASVEERARRRWQERHDRGEEADYDQILADMVRRDRFDGSRAHSPMKAAADAVLIDTTSRAVADILADVLARFTPPVGVPSPAPDAQCTTPNS